MNTTSKHISLTMIQTAHSRVHVAPGEHHYFAVWKASRRPIVVACVKRTGEEWECAVHRTSRTKSGSTSELLGVFRCARMTERTVKREVEAIVLHNLYGRYSNAA